MKSRVAGRVESDGDQGIGGEVTDIDESGDTLSQTQEIYDLEDEMPEDDVIAEPKKLEESIDPVTPDPFIVEDVSVEESGSVDYSLGFRVQVFASGELEKAEVIKEKVIGESGLEAYIEYEGGLYKVRVGDFSSREAAARARFSLVEMYPDCWIVRTTIKK